MTIPNLPTIPPDAHKYSRGSLLVLGGSARFPGAAILAAQAGSLTGAGYVTLVVPASVVPVAQAHLRSIPVLGAKEADGTLVANGAPVTKGVFAADGLPEILKHVKHIDAVVLGCGLTITPSTIAFAESVRTWADQAGIPLLIDADALQALHSSSAPSSASASTPASAPASPSTPAPAPVVLSPRLVLTPHAGEIARLYASTKTDSPETLAQHLNAVVVAKGPVTCITDGVRVKYCDEGTPALAKAGTGDVLSGIIGSLLAQGMEPFEAAWAGVVIHARAGCLAEKNYGTRSVIAEHLLETIPAVCAKIE